MTGTNQHRYPPDETAGTLPAEALLPSDPDRDAEWAITNATTDEPWLRSLVEWMRADPDSLARLEKDAPRTAGAVRLAMEEIAMEEQEDAAR